MPAPRAEEFIEPGTVARSRNRDGHRIRALPIARALAKRLQLDLDAIPGATSQRPIGLDDVLAAASIAHPRISDGLTVPAGSTAEPLRGARRAMSRSLSMSRDQVSGSTVCDDADIHGWPRHGDYMLRLIRALIAACGAEPSLNAWYDSANSSRILHRHIDLAIAVDTPGGLIVPVLRDIRQKTPAELRAAILEQKTAAHRRHTTPEELRDFTLMLSNFGTLAGRYGIPLVVPPAVAILGAGKVRFDAVVVDGAVLAHRRMPLSLSFRSPLHHRRRGLSVPGRRHRRFRTSQLARGVDTMHQAFPEQHRRIIAGIGAAARRLTKSKRGALPASLPAAQAPAFLRTYYANVEVSDLAGRDPHELAAVALSHLALAAKRRGRALVRVFNPSLREDGYTSAHTVVEMVNDDMPFLVDSIGLALTQRSLMLHFLAHPIFAVTRDGAGNLLSLEERGQTADGKKQRLESFQHIEVDRIVDPQILRALQGEIERSMADVRVACADWQKMQAAAGQAADDLHSLSARFDPRDISETQALLAWMDESPLHISGLSGISAARHRQQGASRPGESTGLGILRPGHKHPESTGRILASDIRRQSRSRDLALVTKANFQSIIHRPGYLDYIGIKHFGPKGELIGERRFLGLWTSAAYTANPSEIPMVRHKVAQVIQHFALAPDSHDGKALQHILESFPRDELFQASVAELNKVVTGIFGLQERPRVRLLLRRDPFRRFYSCLVFVPRDKYNTLVRQRIERVVRDAFNAFSMESQVQIAESNLARIHIVARMLPVESDRVDADELERRVAAAVRSWADAFKSALLARFDEAYALQLYAAYAQAFPAAYTEDFSGDAAAHDVSFLESVEKEPARLHLDIYRPEPQRKDKFFLKIFRDRDAIPISDLLPMFENMGLKVIAERPYELDFATGRRAWIQDLELVMQAPTVIEFDALDREIKSTVTAVWTGRMDSDGFNQLTLTTGVPWRIVTVLRAYCRYLLQTGLPFSQGYIAQVLVDTSALRPRVCGPVRGALRSADSPRRRGAARLRGWSGAFEQRWRR